MAIPRSRKNLVTAAILAAGVLAAAVIYATARPVVEDPLGDPMESKRFIHDMEVYGGKANLVLNDFREWLVAQFQGRQLAFTVLFLAVLLAVVVRALTPPPLSGPRRLG